MQFSSKQDGGHARDRAQSLNAEKKGLISQAFLDSIG
jgi:hypothetical protein